MSGLELEVLCVGHAAYDVTLAVPQHPEADEKTVATELVNCGGGPAANAAVTVARLGQRAAFAGYLGHDEWGERHFQELLQAGVGTAWVARGSAPTPLSVILVKPDGRRAVVNYRRDTPPLPPAAVDLAAVAPRVILFDGHEPQLSVALAQAARARGIPTLLDAGSVHAGTRALAPLVDYLLCSEKFACTFTGENDLARAASQLQAVAPVVVITLGERGLVWQRGAACGQWPAFKVIAVDTTGAGDAWHGALAVGVACQWPWEVSLRYAGAVAALTCTRLGARVGLPTQPEVAKFLETH